MMKEQADGYFGLCPHCHNHDGYINVSRSHWFVCDEHKVKWLVGSNLFSDWRQQTEDEQRRIYDARGIGDYSEVEPYFSQETITKPSDLGSNQEEPFPF